MAIRPIFLPLTEGIVGVKELLLEFNWYPGMSKTQKQKSISSLHGAAKLRGLEPILEISSKSEDELGILLSAFNLCITTKIKNFTFTVETAFQSSKVFERGGPYKDLLGMNSRAAKKDIRLKESGNLVGFEFFGKNFPINPKTYFYDWIYINALIQNQDLTDKLVKFSGFSDIEFNPEKSVNCQAYSAALYLSLRLNKVLERAVESPEAFLEHTATQYAYQKRNIAIQSRF